MTDSTIISIEVGIPEFVALLAQARIKGDLSSWLQGKAEA